MPIVMAGKQFTAQDLKNQSGALAEEIRNLVENAMNLNVQLSTWPDADLILLGLAQEEIDAIKGFYIGDMPAIATALESSTWIKQLLGLGI